jgi:hypothetical protein
MTAKKALVSKGTRTSEKTAATHRDRKTGRFTTMESVRSIERNSKWKNQLPLPRLTEWFKERLI